MAGDKRFRKRAENFVCSVCGRKVEGSGYTDHCPECLWSRHVDINPGDRKSECGGLMGPMHTELLRGQFYILYKCEKCKIKKRCIAASGDNQELLDQLLARF